MNRLNDFELLEKISSGGFATVFRAFQQSTQNWVSVKIINREKLDEAAIKAEIIVQQNLRNSPYLVDCFDIFAVDEHIYIVMELCSDGNLLDYLHNTISLERQTFSETISLHYLRHILLGLEWIHSENIVHGNLDLSNILLYSSHDNDNQHQQPGIKFCDFSFSFLKNSGNAKRHMRLSPIDDTQFQVDIWAAGDIFHQMLTGQSSPTGIADTAEYMRSSLHWLSEESQHLLIQMLETDPNRIVPTASFLLRHPALILSTSGSKKDNIIDNCSEISSIASEHSDYEFINNHNAEHNNAPHYKKHNQVYDRHSSRNDGTTTAQQMNTIRPTLSPPLLPLPYSEEPAVPTKLFTGRGKNHSRGKAASENERQRRSPNRTSGGNNNSNDTNYSNDNNGNNEYNNDNAEINASAAKTPYASYNYNHNAHTGARVSRFSASNEEQQDQQLFRSSRGEQIAALQQIRRLEKQLHSAPRPAQPTQAKPQSVMLQHHSDADRSSSPSRSHSMQQQQQAQVHQLPRQFDYDDPEDRYQNIVSHQHSISITHNNSHSHNRYSSDGPSGHSSSLARSRKLHPDDDTSSNESHNDRHNDIHNDSVHGDSISNGSIQHNSGYDDLYYGAGNHNTAGLLFQTAAQSQPVEVVLPSSRNNHSNPSNNNPNNSHNPSNNSTSFNRDSLNVSNINVSNISSHHSNSRISDNINHNNINNISSISNHRALPSDHQPESSVVFTHHHNHTNSFSNRYATHRRRDPAAEDEEQEETSLRRSYNKKDKKDKPIAAINVVRVAGDTHIHHNNIAEFYVETEQRKLIEQQQQQEQEQFEVAQLESIVRHSSRILHHNYQTTATTITNFAHNAHTTPNHFNHTSRVPVRTSYVDNNGVHQVQLSSDTVGFGFSSSAQTSSASALKTNMAYPHLLQQQLITRTLKTACGLDSLAFVTQKGELVIVCNSNSGVSDSGIGGSNGGSGGSSSSASKQMLYCCPIYTNKTNHNNSNNHHNGNKNSNNNNTSMVTGYTCLLLPVMNVGAELQKYADGILQSSSEDRDSFFDFLLPTYKSNGGDSSSLMATAVVQYCEVACNSNKSNNSNNKNNSDNKNNNSSSAGDEIRSIVRAIIQHNNRHGEEQRHIQHNESMLELYYACCKPSAEGTVPDNRIEFVQYGTHYSGDNCALLPQILPPHIHSTSSRNGHVNNNHNSPQYTTLLSFSQLMGTAVNAQSVDGSAATGSLLSYQVTSAIYCLFSLLSTMAAMTPAVTCYYAPVHQFTVPTPPTDAEVQRETERILAPIRDHTSFLSVQDYRFLMSVVESEQWEEIILRRNTNTHSNNSTNNSGKSDDKSSFIRRRISPLLRSKFPHYRYVSSIAAKFSLMSNQYRFSSSSGTSSSGGHSGYPFKTSSTRPLLHGKWQDGTTLSMDLQTGDLVVWRPAAPDDCTDRDTLSDGPQRESSTVGEASMALRWEGCVRPPAAARAGDKQANLTRSLDEIPKALLSYVTIAQLAAAKCTAEQQKRKNGNNSVVKRSQPIGGHIIFTIDSL